MSKKKGIYNVYFRTGPMVISISADDEADAKEKIEEDYYELSDAQLTVKFLEALRKYGLVVTDVVKVGDINE